MTLATWQNGKRTVKGAWSYLGSDRFLIVLFQRNRLTGESEQRFIHYGDDPDWGNWKRVGDPR